MEAIKRELGELTDWNFIHDQIERAKKYNTYVEYVMKVVPVPFSTEGKQMLQHAKWLMDERDEEGNSIVAIHPSFDKLLISLHTAIAVEYKLDKTAMSFTDVLDAFRLAATFFRREK